MWTRRSFLESLSGLPLVGGLIGGGAALTATATRAQAATPDYFKDLGIKPFINAAGTYTDMTASLMDETTRAAWDYASQHFVYLNDLHDRIGERIAKITHAEAAMVTAGAASAMTLGTAGVLTGTDRQKIINLPNLLNMKTEVIIQKSHRFGYDHAVRNCGVRLIEVETADELERAITWHTAMMLFYNNNNSVGKIRDEEFVRLGKKHGIPTMNDAAADVPPVENLWRYVEMGFDLVVFSGGKGLRGPQSAGVLTGRKDLIEAARMNAAPNGDAIGRGMKVNKEEMLAMLVALETYVAKDHAKERTEFDKRAETIRAAAAAVPGVSAEITVPEVANHVPHVRVTWDAEKLGITPTELSRRLRDGTPSIGVRPGGETMIGVWMMKDGEAEIVATRLREVLEKKG